MNRSWRDGAPGLDAELGTPRRGPLQKRPGLGFLKGVCRFLGVVAAEFEVSAPPRRG